MSIDIKKRIEYTFNTKVKSSQGSGRSEKKILEVINQDLESFIEDVQHTIQTIDPNYNFQKEYKAKVNLTANHLTDIIVEAYFSKRKLKKDDKPIHHLSAGERKKALIDIAYAFLVQKQKQNKKIILAIDEPESSLHISMCYGQFQRLQSLSRDCNVQLLISTHWYGVLPIIDKGSLIHIKNDENADVIISQFDFQNYFQENGLHPDDIHFKSFFDLVSSIISSLRLQNKHWIIVEGEEDKKYISSYIKDEVKNNLIILPVGGCGVVLTLYNYLFPAMSQKQEKKEIKNKVICLVDTDFQALPISLEFKSETKNKSLRIRRLQVNNQSKKIELSRLENMNRFPTEIEESLDPILFYESVSLLVENHGSEDIKEIFKGFRFDRNACNSFIKGDDAIIFYIPNGKIVENPREYKNQLHSFIDKNKSQICEIYCELISDGVRLHKVMLKYLSYSVFDKINSGFCVLRKFNNAPTLNTFKPSWIAELETELEID